MVLMTLLPKASAVIVPGALREFVGCVLHEAGEDSACLGGATLGSVMAGNDHFHVGALGVAAVFGVVVGAFHVFHAG